MAQMIPYICHNFIYDDDGSNKILEFLLKYPKCRDPFILTSNASKPQWNHHTIAESETIGSDERSSCGEEHAQ